MGIEWNTANLWLVAGGCITKTLTLGRQCYSERVFFARCLAKRINTCKRGDCLLGKETVLVMPKGCLSCSARES